MMPEVTPEVLIHVWALRLRRVTVKGIARTLRISEMTVELALNQSPPHNIRELAGLPPDGGAAIMASYAASSRADAIRRMRGFRQARMTEHADALARTYRRDTQPKTPEQIRDSMAFLRAHDVES